MTTAVIVSLEMLQALAGPAPAPRERTSTGTESAFDLVPWFAKHGVTPIRNFTKGDGATYYAVACPFGEGHGERDETCVIQYPSGALSFKCQHGSCTGRGWKEYRAHYEPRKEQTDEPEAWEPPDSLDERTAPPLPLDALPTTLARLVADVSEYAQTPTDLAYLLTLGCLGAVTMRHLRVEGAHGWDEPTNLYVAAVMEPGQRKSEVMRKVAGPLYEWEQHRVDACRVEVARAQEERAADERHLVRLRDDVAKGKAPRGEVDALSERLETTPRPTLPRFIVDDVTPEKAVELLAIHGERLAVLSAEGGLFGVNLGRRYGADGTGHFEVYLKAHGGDPMRVDRVKGGCYILAAPLLSIIVTIQPQVLATAAGDGELVGRGLLARFLVAVPESTMGRRSSKGTPIPPSVLEAWRAVLFRLLDYPPPEGTVLRLSDGASAELGRFRDALEPRLSPAIGDLVGIAGWAAKLHGAVLRLSANLHAVEVIEGRSTWSEPVQVEAMRAAVAIAAALIPHALATMDRAGGDPSADDARSALRWIRRGGAQRFSERDIQRALGRTSDQALAAIKLLVENGHIRPAVDEPRKGPGRAPSPNYDVNPLFLGNSVNSVSTPPIQRGFDHSPSLTLSPYIRHERLTELTEPLVAETPRNGNHHSAPDPSACSNCGSDSCTGSCPPRVGGIQNWEEV